MHRVAWIVFALCLVATGTFIVATTSGLPESVASHFNGSGLANGFMTRDGYCTFMLGFGLVLPAFMAIVVGLVPRLAPSRINVPNRDYWLDPKRRADTLNALSAQGAWLGTLTAAFIAALHYVLLVANRALPPQLPANLFWMLTVGFVVTLALWMAALFLRFRRVG
jgi:uncharacterized membrane protein